MTVAAKPSTISYVEDGVSVSFAVPFRFKAAGDLIVERLSGGMASQLLLGIDYTVAGGDTDAGGTLTRKAATNGATLRIRRNTARIQPMVYSTGDRFPALSHEEALDRATLVDQEQQDQIDETQDRALLAPIGEALKPLTGDRPGRFIGFGVDADQPLMMDGGGADPLLRNDLARPDVGGRAVSFDGRSVTDKLRENVAVTDARFAGGANPVGAADATPAFLAAKLASQQVSAQGQRFILNNFTMDRDYQRWELGGAVLGKAAAAPIVNIPGRGVKLTGGYIEGDGGATDNIVITGQEAEVRVMSNRATTGRAILAINANATLIFGGLHKTEDTSGNGYDTEFRNTGAGSLYNKYLGNFSNQNTGGLLLNGAGATFVGFNQMGKLSTTNGGGGFVVGNRIGGMLNVQSSSINLEANNFASDLVFGTDGRPNIGNIGLGPTCFGQTGKTIDIADNVRESQFFLDQFVHPTTTINIRSYQNAIYLREQAVPLGLGASAGSPTFGNGTVRTQCAFMGWQRKLTGSVTFGSSTNFGGGNAFYFIAPFKAKTTALGHAIATDAGAGFYTFVCRILEGSDQIFFFPTSSGSAVGNPASATTPFTWGADDSLVFEILFEQMAS